MLDDQTGNIVLAQALASKQGAPISNFRLYLNTEQQELEVYKRNVLNSKSSYGVSKVPRHIPFQRLHCFDARA